MHGVRLTRLLAAGCVVGLFGCSDAAPDPLPPGGGRTDDPPMPTQGTLAALARASDCDDLLRKIQDDAIAKVKLAVERARTLGPGGGAFGGGDVDEASADDVGGDVPRSANSGTRGEGAARPPAAPTPTTAGATAGDADAPAPSVPPGASVTNRQVKDVDEADFVKVVGSYPRGDLGRTK